MPTNAIDNARRVGRASDLVGRYRELLEDPAMNNEEAVTHILTDLRHLCAAARIDFADCDRFAKANYESEK